MAQNIVEILVKSRNDTKAGFSQAKADAELAGDEAGQAFSARFARRLGNMWNGNGGGTGGLMGILGGNFQNVGALATGALTIAPAIAAIVVELDGLLAGFTAAAAGVGAFGLLALPTFEKIKNSYTAISAAQNAYNTALTKEHLDPTKTNAHAVATALLNLKVAQQQAGPAVTGVINGIHALGKEFEVFAKPLQPVVLDLFNQALNIASALLPYVAQFADAAAPAIEGFMKSLSRKIDSQGFQNLMTQLEKITPGAITAIGNGILKVAGAFAQLLTAMSPHDVQHAINILFDTLAWFFTTTAKWIKGAMKNWDDLSHDVAMWYQDTRKWLIRAMSDLANWAQDVDNIVGRVIGFWRGLERFFQRLPGEIVHALSTLAGDLFDIGVHAIMGLANGAESMFGGLLARAESWGHDIANAIGAPFGIHFSEPSEATQMVKAGQKAGQGFLRGLHSTGLSGGVALGLGGGGGGAMQLVITGAGAPNFMALVKAIWPSLQFEVRTRGGGGPGSVQKALGQ